MISFRFRFILPWLSVLLVQVACNQSAVPIAPLPDAPSDSSSEAFLVDDLFATDGELVEEYWEAHFLRGAKFGHRQTRRLKLADPPGTKTITVDQLELRRSADINRERLTTVLVEDDEGRLQRLGYEHLSSGRTHPTVVELTVGNDGTALLRRSTGDNAGRGDKRTTTVRIRWSQQQEGFFGIARSLQRMPLVPGQQRQVDVFVPLTDRSATYQLTAVGMESTEVAGGTETLLRVEALDLHPNSWKIPDTFWCQPDGRVRKTQEAFVGRQTVVVDEQTAKQPNDTYRLDVGIDTGVRLERPLGRAEYLDQLTYEVHLQGLNPVEIFPNEISQLVRPGPNRNRATITVRRITPHDPSEVPAEDPPGDEYLTPNEWIESDDPEIVSLAKAIRSEDPWQTAQGIERHLKRVIQEKNYAKVFNSAAEVMRQKQGDCSEHAVLLAAVCRANQIPARVVVGLIYEDSRQSFLYHMWNEVWIDDRWLPLDATRGRGSIGPTYLKLRHSSLTNQHAYGVVAPVVYLMDRLEIHPILPRSR